MQVKAKNKQSEFVVALLMVSFVLVLTLGLPGKTEAVITFTEPVLAKNTEDRFGTVTILEPLMQFNDPADSGLPFKALMNLKKEVDDEEMESEIDDRELGWKLSSNVGELTENQILWEFAGNVENSFVGINGWTIVKQKFSGSSTSVFWTKPNHDWTVGIHIFSTWVLSDVYDVDKEKFISKSKVGNDLLFPDSDAVWAGVDGIPLSVPEIPAGAIVPLGFVMLGSILYLRRRRISV